MTDDYAMHATCESITIAGLLISVAIECGLEKSVAIECGLEKCVAIHCGFEKCVFFILDGRSGANIDRIGQIMFRALKALKCRSDSALEP